MNLMTGSYFNIYNFWKVIFKNKTIFLLMIFLGVAAGVLKSNFTSPSYTSSAMLLLPESSAIGLSQSSVSSIFTPTSFSSADTIILIVKSGRMKKDINEKYHVRFRIEAYQLRNSVIIEIITKDPAISRDIANFCISNMDKINNELHITENKPMTKVLDRPEYGKPVSGDPKKGAIAGGLFAFMLCFIWFFIVEYTRYYYKRIEA